MAGAFDWIGSIFGGGGFAPVSSAGAVPASGAPLATDADMQQAGWDMSAPTLADPTAFANTGAPGAGAVDTGAAGFDTGGPWGGVTADKLKTAIAGLGGLAKTQAQSDAQTQAQGWPFGQPRAGAAQQSKGTPSAGLADMINTLRQRQQQLQSQYLARGNLAPRGPGGGLLGF
jgi:hypothetical protein